MSARDILLQLESAISTSNAQETFRRLADLFFQELLEYPDFPEDYFSVLSEILSRSDLFLVSGAEMFLYQTYASRDALSSAQMKRLLDLLTSHYTSYTTQKLCLMVSDFLGRAFPPRIALEAVEQLAPKVTTSDQSTGLLLTLDILFKSDKLDKESQTEWRRIKDSLVSTHRSLIRESR